MTEDDRGTEEGVVEEDEAVKDELISNEVGANEVIRGSCNESTLP